MSSGGMDWAYRMIAAHKLDGLGMAVVLHLGWRDAADFRTDRGIARALCRDRRTIRDVTAKLVAQGVIERLSGQWVAVETAQIVREEAGARRPSPEAADAEPGAVKARRGRGSQAPGGVRPPPPGVSDPRKRGSETPPKRKENFEKGRAVRAEASSCSISGAASSPASRPSPRPPALSVPSGEPRSPEVVNALRLFHRMPLADPERGQIAAWLAVQGVEVPGWPGGAVLRRAGRPELAGRG